MLKRPIDYNMTKSEFSAVTGAPDGGLSAILESKGIKVTDSEYPLFLGRHKRFEWGRNVKEGLPCYLSKIDTDGEDFEFVSVHKENCKSWMCKDCRKSKGHKLRSALLAKSYLFKVPRLFTITVNRDWFASAEASYNYIMSKKFIARLFKKLGIKRWVWVLEFQEGSGEGWPHWHCLIDISDLPGKYYENGIVTDSFSSTAVYIPHYFDLKRAKYYLKKWRIGKQCKLSVKKDSFQSIEHAIKYISKYLIKYPKRGYPEWVLNKTGIRFYQPSFAVGSLTLSKSSNDFYDDDFVDDDIEVVKYVRSAPRKPIDKISECKYKIMYLGHTSTGEKIYLGNSLSYPNLIQDYIYSSIRNNGEYCIYGFSTMQAFRKFHALLHSIRDDVENLILTLKNQFLNQWELSLC